MMIWYLWRSYSTAHSTHTENKIINNPVMGQMLTWHTISIQFRFNGWNIIPAEFLLLCICIFLLGKALHIHPVNRCELDAQRIFDGNYGINECQFWFERLMGFCGEIAPERICVTPNTCAGPPIMPSCRSGKNNNNIIIIIIIIMAIPRNLGTACAFSHGDHETNK